MFHYAKIPPNITLMGEYGQGMSGSRPFKRRTSGLRVDVAGSRGNG